MEPNPGLFLRRHEEVSYFVSLLLRWEEGKITWNQFYSFKVLWLKSECKVADLMRKTDFTLTIPRRLS